MQPTFTTDEARWAAVIARDAAAEGAFLFSVRTTGVYCRPTCAARQPLRENVAFYDTTAEAEAAGFRPCKRCRPTEPALAERRAAAAALACRLIDEAETPPALEDLARATGLSPHHFHRVFKEAVGVTPRAYAAQRRTDRVRQGLVQAASVTEAIYDAGFNSGGRFYETAGEVLGMTPSAFRAGGKGAAIRFAVGECSLGSVLVATSDKGVCAILLGDDPDALVRDLQDRFDRAELIGGDPEFEALVARVVGLVENPRQGLDLPLDVRGTAFQHRVWRALREIPPGSRESYADVARRIGAPKAVRAVAGACAANALAIAIPCHRVVRQDGALSGYRWGVERKAALLEREAAA